MGKRPITEIEAPEILAVLKRMMAEERVSPSTACAAKFRRVFLYGVKEGLCISNPAAALVKAIPPAKATHFASITDPAKVGEMLRPSMASAAPSRFYAPSSWHR
ncbi:MULTISPECIES: phage integrase central domain-containing protein [Cupriavidus]